MPSISQVQKRLRKHLVEAITPARIDEALNCLFRAIKPNAAGGSDDPKTAIAAAKVILEYGAGKATEFIDIKTTSTSVTFALQINATKQIEDGSNDQLSASEALPETDRFCRLP